MDEYAYPVSWEHDIWRPREAPHVQPVAKALRMQQFAHFYFWTGILAADTGHHAGANLFADYVHLDIPVAG